MKPDARDLHIYGGLALLGMGVESALWGVALVGLALAYFGVWRMESPEKEDE